MGCVSSKLNRKGFQTEILCGVNGDYFPNHVVSLTSSTYGVLKLDISDSPKSLKKAREAEEDADKKHSPLKKEGREDVDWDEETEVINTWELMVDLEEETTPITTRGKNSPKSVGRSPFKRINKLGSPKTVKKSPMGKENRLSEQCNSNTGSVGVAVKATYFTPKRISKSWDFPEKATDSSSRRKSLTPLFDPELLEAYEKELCLEREQIKKIISQTPISNSGGKNSSRRFDSLLDEFELKCPPGGEDSVVVYTTTLRGVRKTFEECNTVRSILESHQIKMYERDLSMDSGFKEELRKLMEGDVKGMFRIPLVFVKGRLIGGADVISKLEEEGKLESLLHQIPKNSGSACDVCGGVRFVMCSDCNGSCKVLDEDQKETVRCGECNENGLIHCPLCC